MFYTLLWPIFTLLLPLLQQAVTSVNLALTSTVPCFGIYFTLHLPLLQHAVTSITQCVDLKIPFSLYSTLLRPLLYLPVTSAAQYLLLILKDHHVKKTLFLIVRN
jgi:hypothetical protein